ncbi:MAG: YdcF family protein [Faecalibacterium sp.]|nr:YdcF family protein [Ruminococcus sp.]MCM1392281.1 YdcF family protein [Ruminococcus sp.]MCM1486556.1 YdcF family protein [Faecalibacterium sp.]
MIAQKIIFPIFLTSAAVLGTFTAAEIIASKGNCTSEPDFFLILGCRVRGDKPEETLQTRINAAAEYLTQHKNVIAICCGGIVHDDQTKSEAQAMFEGLTALGIEKERIILEDQSTTTAENFINAKKIIDNMKLERTAKLAFMSSEFHLLRSGIIGKIAGVKAESIPAPSPKNLRFKNYARELAVFVSIFSAKQK